MTAGISLQEFKSSEKPSEICFQFYFFKVTNNIKNQKRSQPIDSKEDDKT